MLKNSVKKRVGASLGAVAIALVSATATALGAEARLPVQLRLGLRLARTGVGLVQRRLGECPSGGGLQPLRWPTRCTGHGSEWVGRVDDRRMRSVRPSDVGGFNISA